MGRKRTCLWKRCAWQPLLTLILYPLLEGKPPPRARICNVTCFERTSTRTNGSSSWSCNLYLTLLALSGGCFPVGRGSCGQRGQSCNVSPAKPCNDHRGKSKFC